MDPQRNLQLLVEGDRRLVMIGTQQSGHVLDLFQRYSRMTGKAVYHWAPDQGLKRLGIGHIPIPKTERSGEALDYIRSTKHFGVYVLDQFAPELQLASNQETLRQIAGSGGSQTVVLLDAEPSVPESLAGLVIQVRHARSQPRLRHGRWVTE
jgi:hypothetical protein